MKSFRKLTLATLIAVYVLILVGGIVRSTGSGMGCPDWPKCFGRWVPPIGIEELPTNYKEQYSDYRDKKNERFINYLIWFGFEDTAEKIKNDKSILIEADFNVLKTWVEYMNRIVGVIIGLLIFAVAITSIKFWKWDKKITIVAFTTLVVVGFQGWIGSVVVSTNLTPWVVTIHMLLALVIVAQLTFLIYDKEYRNEKYTVWGVPLVSFCMVTLAIQIVLGTQIREAIDRVSGLIPRTQWIEAVQYPFLIHRTFSWVVLCVYGIFIRNLIKSRKPKQLLLPYTTSVCVLITVLTGIGMAYLGMPAWLQPIHLTLATITFGMFFLIFLQLLSKRSVTNK